MRGVAGLILAVIVTLLPRAISAGQRTERTEIPLAGSKLPRSVRFGPAFRIDEDGLVLGPQATPEGAWIESGWIPVRTSWQPPASVHVVVTVHGSGTAGSQVRVLVRHSCDATHWSAWEPMPETVKVSGGMSSYSLVVGGDAGQRAEYEALRREWLETKPAWTADEEALSRWLVDRSPGYFARSHPYVGYVQLRVEAKAPPEGRVRLSSLSTKLWFLTSGAVPRRPRGYPPMGPSWSFRPLPPSSQPSAKPAGSGCTSCSVADGDGAPRGLLVLLATLALLRATSRRGRRPGRPGTS